MPPPIGRHVTRGRKLSFSASADSRGREGDRQLDLAEAHQSELDSTSRCGLDGASGGSRAARGPGAIQYGASRECSGRGAIVATAVLATPAKTRTNLVGVGAQGSLTGEPPWGWGQGDGGSSTGGVRRSTALG